MAEPRACLFTHSSPGLQGLVAFLWEIGRCWTLCTLADSAGHTLFCRPAIVSGSLPDLELSELPVRAEEWGAGVQLHQRWDGIEGHWAVPCGDSAKAML